MRSGYVAGGWFGMAVSGRTPAPIQKAIESVGLELVKEKTTIDRLATLLSEPVGANRETFNRFLAEERQRWGSILQSLKPKG